MSEISPYLLTFNHIPKQTQSFVFNEVERMNIGQPVVMSIAGTSCSNTIEVTLSVNFCEFSWGSHICTESSPQTQSI